MAEMKERLVALRVIPMLLLAAIFFEGLNAYAERETPGGFSAAEIKSILPLFDQFGMIALAENKPSGAPKAMTLAVRINAPRKVAFKVFENPENFIYLSRLFKENKVREEHDNAKSWTWASRHKWFSFVGRNTIASYPPRRVDIRIAKSSVGSGSFRILFYEDGPDNTILVLSGILDVQSSDFLIRYLMGMNPVMSLATNVAIGIVIVKGAKALAERTAVGKPLEKHRTRGKRTGSMKPLDKQQLIALNSLLDRGLVVMTSSVKRGRLSQATVVEKIKAPGRKFLVAAATPEVYPQMIKAITDLQVHERTDQATEFSWTLGFHILGLTSRNRLTFVPDGVMIKGLDGDLPGALWRWQIIDNGQNEAIVGYHSWADIPKTHYILDKSMKAEPYLEHGFMAGSNMVMLRALKHVVEQH